MRRDSGKPVGTVGADGLGGLRALREHCADEEFLRGGLRRWASAKFGVDNDRALLSLFLSFHTLRVRSHTLQFRAIRYGLGTDGESLSTDDTAIFYRSMDIRPIDRNMSFLPSPPVHIADI